MKKIQDLASLSKIVKKLKGQKKTIVFTNGCFDFFHYGHLVSLEKAKKYGDVLIVGINSDCSVKKLKGKTRPVFGQKERANIVCGLECVDYCVVFNELTPLKIIKSLKPDIIVKGADYKDKTVVGEDVLKKYKGKVVLIPLVKNISTTELIKKSNIGILRIIDANFNRAKEGFRVIEDSLRFYYNEKQITGKLKHIRHKFTDEIIKNFGDGLPLWRDPQKDVGKDTKENRVKNIIQIIRQNFGRIEEALRTIEEYGKIIKSDSVGIWVELRFHVYQLEKEVLKKLKTIKS